jgi:hypothetical protein
MGLIYILKPKESNEMVYIGSTKKTLQQRFQGHGFKGCSSNEIFNKYPKNLCEISLIRECSDDQLEVEERKEILKARETGNCVNKVLPGKFPKEERTSIYARRTAKFACDCGNMTDLAHYARHKKTIRCKKILSIKATTSNLANITQPTSVAN